MDEIELTRILRGSEVTAPYFCGVISHDQLNILPAPSIGFYICNSDDSKGPGKHWLAVAWFRGEQPAEFFDSLAHLPMDYNENFTNFLINHGPPYSYGTVRIQSETSVKCGEFCVFYAYHRCKGFTLEEILSMFTKKSLNINDVIVERFADNL